MFIYRRTYRRTVLLLSLLVFLSPLCSPSATLHVHSLDHGHDEYFDHSHAVDEARDHSRLSKAHYAHDVSHDDHHDGLVSEFDASPDGVLKSLSNNIFALVLFALLFTLVSPAPSCRVVQRHRESTHPLHRPRLLSPPLRAPPRRF